MAILKCKSYKNQVKTALDYLLKEDKADIVSSQYLNNSEDYSMQMRNTANRFSKNKKVTERKYYSFIISPNNLDNPTPQQSHLPATEFAQKLFPNFEAIIVTHNDTDNVHSHIIINSVSFTDGKKVQLGRVGKHKGTYAYCKDQLQIIAKKQGLTPTDWREATRLKRKKQKAGKDLHQLSKVEQHIEARAESLGLDGGALSWKEALRRCIDDAKENAASRIEFEEYLTEQYDIEMPRNTDKTVSFKHPAVKETVRGNKLGYEYAAEAIDIDLELTFKRKQYYEEYYRELRLNEDARVGAVELLNTADDTTKTNIGRYGNEILTDDREEQIKRQQKLREQAKRDEQLRQRIEQESQSVVQSKRAAQRGFSR